jgi:hypothetical protein
MAAGQPGDTRPSAHGKPVNVFREPSEAMLEYTNDTPDYVYTSTVGIGM